MSGKTVVTWMDVSWEGFVTDLLQSPMLYNLL